MQSDKKNDTVQSLQEQEPFQALLISAYKGSGEKETCIEHLQELKLLAETYGVKVVGKLPCAVRRYDASTYITEGKLEEAITVAKQANANLVIFDDEISPGQQRNLEIAFNVPVIDRTEVILGVFAQRAQTKEARLQIELAQVRYQAPRLKRLWTHLSRQHGSGGGGSGGGGYTKGEGEKQIEIDRRILKRKIDLLQRDIEEVRSHRETQRLSRQRAAIPVFAIIGYTNVGKSTLLNMITGDMVKTGTVIIDVGINKIDNPERSSGYQLVGDVDFENVKGKCSFITPVPGGVGPMTIAMLLSNTLKAFFHKHPEGE